MQKARAAPSGDKHDFLTLAPYWWPDPTKPGGLPYVRRDGETQHDVWRQMDYRALDGVRILEADFAGGRMRIVAGPRAPRVRFVSKSGSRRSAHEILPTPGE